jgi:ribosomal protein L37E
MGSKREKAADEVFCRSCGEAIKQEAEICPSCGVRNKDHHRSSSGRATEGTPHDPTEYETTVSGTWWYGVAGGVALWVLVFLLSGFGGGGLETFAGLLALLAWVGLPVAIYFDIQYIRANGDWNPNIAVWVVLSALWIVNIIAGAVFLYRRHEVLGEP